MGDKKTSQEAEILAAAITGAEMIRVALAGSNYFFYGSSFATWIAAGVLLPVSITVAGAQALVTGAAVVPGRVYNITDSSQAIDPGDRIWVRGSSATTFDQGAMYIDNVNGQRNEIIYIIDDVPTDLIIFRRDNRGSEVWDIGNFGTLVTYPWSSVNCNSNVVRGGLTSNDWGTNQLIGNVFLEACVLGAGGFSPVTCAYNQCAYGVTIIAGANNASILDNRIGNNAALTCSKKIDNCTIGENAIIDDNGFSLINCTFPSGMTFIADRDYTNVDFSKTIHGLSQQCVNITVADTPYTVLDSDVTIIGNSAGGAIDVNLPPANAGKRLLNIKNLDGVNKITVTPVGGNTIEGALTYSVDTIANRSLQIQSDGVSSWWIVASHLI